MDIKIDSQIETKIALEVNRYIKANGKMPSNISLNSDQYRDLWLTLYTNQIKTIIEPFVLTHYLNCKLLIEFVNDVNCF